MKTFFLIIAVAVAGFLVAFLFMFIFLHKLRGKSKKLNKAIKDGTGVDWIDLKIEILRSIQSVVDVIRSGTWTYLRRQYKLAAVVLAILTTLLTTLWYYDFVTIYTIFAAMTGFLFSMITGSFGVSIATKANGLIAIDSNHSLKQTSNTSSRAGMIPGLFAHGFVLLDIAFWLALIYFFEKEIFAGSIVATFSFISVVIVTFGVGASSYALIARVGGGVYTKSADVGSDRVGKEEMGLEEDSPLNPGATADNVGDNVGDINGQFADLYESTVGILVTSILLFTACFINDPVMLGNSILLSMSLLAFGVVASLIGMYFAYARSNDKKKIISANKRGLFFASIAMIIFGTVASYYTVGIIFAFPIILGLIAGNLFSFAAEFFNSSFYRPVKGLVKSASEGYSSMILANFANGKTSAGVTVLLLVLIAMVPLRIFFPPELFNIGMALMTMAMISPLALILGQDAEGPMNDNAQGINEMTKASAVAIRNTNIMDSIGNTSAAKLKGFAIGTAALTAFLMILAYIETAEIIVANLKLDPSLILDFSFKNPDIMIGLFFGGSLIFILNGNLINVVREVADVLADNIRAQFRQIFKAAEKGIELKPDPNQCIEITTKAAQKSILFPLFLAFFGSLTSGLIGGIPMVVGTLSGLAIVGVLSSLFQANMGGSADNAKKDIEAGAEGGKNSPAHKAAIVADTVGDPLKDTSGPAINIFIKLVSMISIVLAGPIIYIKYIM